MRDISMERVNETRKNILEIIESATLTHEQKLTCLANQADSLMEVLDLPEGLDELLNVPIDVNVSAICPRDMRLCVPVTLSRIMRNL